MKKVFKGTGLLFLAFIVSALIAALPIFRGKNYAQGFDGDTDRSCVIDDIAILDDYSMERMNELIRETAEKLEMNVIVFIDRDVRTDYQTEKYADDLYDELCGEFTDGLLLYLDFSGRRNAYDYVSCSGKAGLVFYPHINDIRDKLLPYLPKSGAPFDQMGMEMVIERYCTVLIDLNKQHGLPNRFYYAHDKKNGFYYHAAGKKVYVTKATPPGRRLKAMFLGSIIGLIIGLIAYKVTKSNYKFKNKTSATVYVSNGDTKFQEKSDTYIRSHTTKTRIQSSSGSSSGRSFGGGGGSHVGGGWHR